MLLSHWSVTSVKTANSPVPPSRSLWYTKYLLHCPQRAHTHHTRKLRVSAAPPAHKETRRYPPLHRWVSRNYQANRLLWSFQPESATTVGLNQFWTARPNLSTALHSPQLKEPERLSTATCQALSGEGFVKVPKKRAYVERFRHSKVLGLLGGKALVGCVASIAQPCLLLKTLNALLGLFWEQRRWQSCPSPSPTTNWGSSTRTSAVLPRSKRPHWPSEDGGSPRQAPQQ